MTELKSKVSITTLSTTRTPLVSVSIQALVHMHGKSHLYPVKHSNCASFWNMEALGSSILLPSKQGVRGKTTTMLMQDSTVRLLRVSVTRTAKVTSRPMQRQMHFALSPAETFGQLYLRAGNEGICLLSGCLRRLNAAEVASTFAGLPKGVEWSLKDAPIIPISMSGMTEAQPSQSRITIGVDGEEEAVHVVRRRRKIG